MLLFMLHRLWSIITDSDSVVSSIVALYPALLSFHMLAGNLDRAQALAGVALVGGAIIQEEDISEHVL